MKTRGKYLEAIKAAYPKENTVTSTCCYAISENESQ